MTKKGTKKGFTLIELSFAILFISMLLLTLTLIASEIIAIYRKGYAIKTINSVGPTLLPARLPENLMTSALLNIPTALA